MILIVYLTGDVKKFYSEKDVLCYVLQNCPRVTFTFLKNLAAWLDRKYLGLPFVCETYNFYIVKKE